MIRIITLSLLLYLVHTVVPCISAGQSVEQIKADRGRYIWGEGRGTTISKADQVALEGLISQISVMVDTRFSLLKEEMMQAGKSDFKSEFKQMVTTYSTAMLTNTERIVLSDEPDAIVFRYVARDEIAKIFSQRNRKILDFTAAADKALEEARAGDALKYYYWALTLLRSLPDGESLTYTPGKGEARLLTGYLPDQINRVLDGLTFRVEKITDNPGYRLVTLHITFDGKPVQNLEYAYWDGRDFSQPVSAKDGLGFVEFYGETASGRESVQLRTEYICEGEARIDRELEEVLRRLDPVPFRNAYHTIPLSESKPPEPSPQEQKNQETTAVEPAEVKPETSAISFLPEGEEQKYGAPVGMVIASVRNGGYAADSAAFTPEGYEVYKKLVGYGRARILEEREISAVRLGQTVICRGPKLSFSFPGNNRKFVEDLVFHFNEEGKIETLSFGLNEVSLEGILSKSAWSETERLTLVNFLEHYKTAYALKRLDYISSIFADDAVIITGNVAKVRPDVENPFRESTIIRYNRYNKTQYLKALEHIFAGNEFINIGFEECSIRKGGKSGDMFGVQIKQNYFSTHYGDQGYLFLLIDFSTPDEPLIHVRTWQPTKNADGSIFGIEDF